MKPASISEEELLNLISSVNNDDNLGGPLVQLPLPEHAEYRKVCNAVSPVEDVGGFRAISMGRMCLDQYSLLPAALWGVWGINKQTSDATVGVRSLITADIYMWANLE